MTDTAIRADGLRKRYGETDALDGFDLAVPTGSVRGLLGPNGAGKTTAVRILSTLLCCDGGRAEVAGFDVVTEAAQVRCRIGLAGQYPAVDEVLTGRQNLVMFGRLSHLGVPVARRRADELVDRFDLAAAADRPAGQYSGGMRRRLDLAASFVTAPPVLFLDEPTTGLDPRHRAEVWQVVRDLVADGTSVLLTSHYLDEVDQLADHVSVIGKGRVLAEGTPDQLKTAVGRDRLDVVLRNTADLPKAAALLGRVADAEPTVVPELRQISVPVAERVAALTEVLSLLAVERLVVEDIGIRRPTLDEVFLRFTEEAVA